jgi:hypothetical protein
MVIEVKNLEKVMAAIKKANALDVSINIFTIAGIQRLSIIYEQLDGTNIQVELAENESGGFDYITRKERF